MARPRASESGGQFAARASSLCAAETAAAVAVAIAVAVAEEGESLLLGLGLGLFLVAAFLDDDDDEGGLQFRKEVQTLHGFPSGPRTIPGGRVGAGPEVLIVGPSKEICDGRYGILGAICRGTAWPLPRYDFLLIL